MIERLKRLPKTQQAIAALLLVALLVYGISLLIVHQKTKDLTQTLELQLAEQRDTLKTVAESTARNGTDDNAIMVVRDCAVDERKQFDTLLGSLDKGLSDADLRTLERLFGRCGAFFAEQRLIMSSRLEREVEIFENQLNQLEILRGESTTEKYRLADWKLLAEEEQKQSNIFMQLVTLQDKIIATLLEGKASDSEEIKAILSEVSEAQGMLIVTNKQAAAIRTELTAP